MKDAKERFDEAYKKFCKLRYLVARAVDVHDEFLSMLEVSVEEFFKMIDQEGYNYDEVLIHELNSIYNGEITGLIEFVENATHEIPNDLNCKIVFLYTVLENRNTDKDITDELCRVGEVLLTKQNWPLVSLVVESFSVFGNELGISLIEKILAKFQNDDYYDGDFGNNIMLYLLSVKNRKAYDFILRHQDIKTSGLDMLFVHMKDEYERLGYDKM